MTQMLVRDGIPVLTDRVQLVRDEVLECRDFEPVGQNPEMDEMVLSVSCFGINGVQLALCVRWLPADYISSGLREVVFEFLAVHSLNHEKESLGWDVVEAGGLGFSVKEYAIESFFEDRGVEAGDLLVDSERLLLISGADMKHD